ncbi:MAG: carboxypeptidase-like regulatory domain-containing protein, partial [Bryobacteraceae bacterium]
MRLRIGFVLCAVAVFIPTTFGQETRGMIYGRVTDPQGAVVPGVRVTVTNLDTNTSVETQSNASGYYEANLLIHGNYQVSFEAAGFRRLVRRGIVLPMSTRVEVSVTLELGPVAESVTVEAAAPLIDAVSASSGRVLDNRT